MNKPQLTDKDLHCIARQIQSLQAAPDDAPCHKRFYGCMYCVYQFECDPPRRDPEYHFPKAFKKLEELTGVLVYGGTPKEPEKAFLPASIILERPGLLPCVTMYHLDRREKFEAHLLKLLNASTEDRDNRMDFANYLAQVMSTSAIGSDKK